MLSFLVIFGVFTFGLNSYNNYAKPMGFNYDKVWAISYNNTLETNNPDSVTLVYETLLRNIKSMPLVVDAGYASANIPFSNNHMTTGITNNGVYADRINNFSIDENYLGVTGAKMIAGRWYTKADKESKAKIIIINKCLKKSYLEKQTP